MRILWLAPFPHPHRSTTHPAPWLTSLARALVTQPDLELTILNWDEQQTAPVEEFEHDGLRFIFLRTPRNRADILTLYTRRIARTAEFLRQHHHRFDLIHVHGSELQYQAAVAGLEVPVLLSVQGLVSECLQRLPERLTMRRALWTLASYYERRHLPGIHHFSCRTHWDKACINRLSPGAHIHHNWEMLRPEFFRAQRPAHTSATPQILFMGGTQRMKGFREAMQAFDLVRKQVPARMVLVGDSHPEEITQYIRQAGLRHVQPADVDCRGYQSTTELLRLFGQSFCLLHPSYIDNSPNSVCEAQVAGLPVVASDVGGVSSLIEHEHTGLLSDLTPANLAAQVLRLYQEPGLAGRLAAAAQDVARRRHDPGTILERTLAIYRTVQQAHVGPMARPLAYA
ncbi:glycosyltransferase [Hymenobacter sp. 15J16-1T3B]|uniref:glycosyltransferase family 4 protein n=1 Tax=Hymenobacter sp. 15J16-1T3B TaxID=2886941 RepID=UPI001D1164B8|nr:glycosyltransferase [Hymenobacter sp. 15J16-1T3B]MCC3158526.1 glycosyltransferase [Hymenobacter sp. 15J16-1T3B]